jgi:PhnB protein
VTPYLSVRDGAKAMEFYRRAFGAKELIRRTTPDGKIVHGRLKIGNSILMLSDQFGAMSAPDTTTATGNRVTIHLYFPDVRSAWAKAVKAGATIVMPLDDQFWGERYGQLDDPFGHHWSLAQVVPMSKAEKSMKEKEAMAMFASGSSAD